MPSLWGMEELVGGRRFNYENYWSLHEESKNLINIDASEILNLIDNFLSRIEMTRESLKQ